MLTIIHLIKSEMQEFCEITLSKIINDCWQGTPPDPEDILSFQKYIECPDMRKAWISLLNQKRISCSFEVPDTTFPTLGELMNYLLDIIYSVKDFQIARKCIIYSQTFHNGERVYLQSLIEDNSIWGDLVTWERMLRLALAEEIKVFAEFCFEDWDCVDELNMRVRTIMISQIAAYAHIMESFRLPQPKIDLFLEKFGKEYGLTSDLQFIN